MEPADVAWILAAVALVLLMFPGLAMLYGGMLSGRSVINMMMMVMSSLAVTTVIYVIVGHGLVVGESVGGLGLIGDPTSYSFFSGLVHDDGEGTTLFGAFYILFAAISVALVASGAAGAFGMIQVKDRVGIDDAADVFAVHGVAGMVGALFVVFFADPATPAERTGILFGGEWDLLWREVVAIVVTVVFSFVVTFIIAKVMNMVHPIRFEESVEIRGVDAQVHAETAYERDSAYDRVIE